MWSFDRRTLLLGALGLGACGFSPVYGPGGSGDALHDAVLLEAPETTEAYLYSRRFEERLGRAAASAPYRLSVTFEIEESAVGSTSAGEDTRYRLIGRARFRLIEVATGQQVHSAATNAFTGYSTTGSTVATRASERAARERLMTMLADQTVDDLVLAADDFVG
ncbi:MULTISPECIES: LPS assembly lipoprotein LptE [Ponticoccus]|uniref:LPS assembly lipoprotein LptE n=1 Tax=Ponticoccus litoralis TaxID=422297 RepID=A0AAW9SNG0_9RHOB